MMKEGFIVGLMVGGLVGVALHKYCKNVQKLADKGEKMGVLESRKLISWYISGIFGAPEARARVNSSTSLEEIEQILLDLRANNK